MDRRHYNKTPSLNTYIRRKIDMITREFMIRLTPEQLAYFYTLNSEIKVDQYARYILKGE